MVETVLHESEDVFAARRQAILKNIKGEAALFVSQAKQTISRDLSYPLRQDSDFFYLTGIKEEPAALLLLANSSGPRSVLFLRERNPEMERWEGETLGIKRAKRRFQIDEIREYKDLRTSLSSYLRNSEMLYYGLGTHPSVDRLIIDFLSSQIGPHVNRPNGLIDSRLLTSEMRFVKDKKEIRKIKHAVSITAKSFMALAPDLPYAKSELHAAKVLESYFAKFGATDLAFPTIVASGKNATCLHHLPQLQSLWKRDLVLIDAGAYHGGYAADITRTFPAGRKFNSAQADIYDVVQSALVAGTARSKPGATLDSIHSACVKAIVRGLVDLRILRGNVSSIISSGKYKQFFMHRSGHLLGVDTHDINPIYRPRSNVRLSVYSRPLRAGCVFTMEPGLYFDVEDRTVPKAFRGIGVRIEDDILITESGRQVLSEELPSEREKIEELMQERV